VHLDIYYEKWSFPPISTKQTIYLCNIYVSTGGWVHSVSFSPSGDKLAWIGHDSSVSVADAANGNR